MITISIHVLDFQKCGVLSPISISVSMPISISWHHGSQGSICLLIWSVTEVPYDLFFVLSFSFKPFQSLETHYQLKFGLIFTLHSNLRGGCVTYMISIIRCLYFNIYSFLGHSKLLICHTVINHNAWSHVLQSTSAQSINIVLSSLAFFMLYESMILEAPSPNHVHCCSN